MAPPFSSPLSSTRPWSTRSRWPAWPAPPLPALVGGLTAVSLAVPLVATPLTPVLAGPVVCTTTLEAPAQPGAAPQEMTRCGAVETVPELVERRFFTYTAPFAEGVSIRGQLRDLGGVATGSVNSGNAIRVFGFPDQTIIWDGTALQNTTEVLLEAQSDPMPWRSADIPNGFGCSIAAPGGCQRSVSPGGRSASHRTPVRGLW